ncbi:aminotransferase class III-fold pyridoxal phosphate-dependent enzyme [Permianibacter sp. IMCC34836]|uniref:aminotransferase family protein n=1 Tax=Permianibacter fluminis TaxID=2738515 RepID=UPI001553AA2D|nr:aminotransferase class III-fold pyridoxal phosphate-dependent enzyme [Permianibacter fluminis]NQD36356.1 aminotransferase class III-fold pyridoxal phosphate-dependent enzyme [Permianibacter fluminis]
MLPERQTVLHSWCRQTEWDAPTVTGGAGARFFTADGRAILDMSSLAECNNLGHQHPHVVAAIKAQASQLCFVTNAWGAEPRARLAELLLEKSGFDGGRVFFTLGGADANENAIKFARQARGLPRGWAITRDRSYHGASYAAMALSGDSRTRQQVDPEAHRVLQAWPPYGYRCPFASDSVSECAQLAADQIAALIDDHTDDPVAAVLMEPNAGTNGIVAPDNYWPALRELTRKRGVLLIADEVMSGFGRCGQWFAWQRYGDENRPDLMTLAKGLTGAHVPLGAVVVSADVARVLAPQMLYTGLTYCGHPLACAAGVAAVESYQNENLIERSRVLGEQMFRSLQGLQRKHAVIGEVRGGHGLFAVVELIRNRASKEPLAPWPESHPALKELVRSGLAANVSFATRGNLIILAPPLVISEPDLGDAIALLDRLLGELGQTLANDGTANAVNDNRV